MKISNCCSEPQDDNYQALCPECGEHCDWIDDCDLENPEDEICGNCNGSGEGYVDGSRCTVCKGSGVEPPEQEEMDFDNNTYEDEQ